jgi:hypothetical protein
MQTILTGEEGKVMMRRGSIMSGTVREDLSVFVFEAWESWSGSYHLRFQRGAEDHDMKDLQLGESMSWEMLDHWLSSEIISLGLSGSE